MDQLLLTEIFDEFEMYGNEDDVDNRGYY